MAYNDKVVDVVVALGTQPIDTVGFETPMFLAVHKVFAERQRSYISTDEMEQDGFAIGSPAHQFATKAFAGSFAPQMIVIGRQDLTETTITFTGFQNDVTVAVNVSAGILRKSVRFPIVGAVVTPTEVATGIAAAFAADAELVAAGVTAAAAAGVVTVTSTDGVSVGYDAGNYLITNESSESVSNTLGLILDENANWYFLSTEGHADADIVAAASFADTHFKLHAYSTDDVNATAAENVTSSIADRLKALSYNSVGIYDPTADAAFPEGGIIGAMAANDPSFGDSIHLKTMKGVVAPKLSTSQRANIWGRNLNYYRVDYGVGGFFEGKCASGQYVDVIRFAHWIKFRLEESVFGHMSRRSNLGLSVKMSDDDLPSLRSVMMNNPINVGIQNGAILTGYDEENKVFYDPIITIPKRAQIPTNDLAARTLNDVKVELVYNNSLHFVKIRVSVLLDRPAATTGSGQNTTATGA